MIFSDLKQYNTEKILKMSLLHDLAESVIGDLTPGEISKIKKAELENITMKNILENLPPNLAEYYSNIWNEYQDNQTEESILVHEFDRLDMVFQAKKYSESGHSTLELRAGHGDLGVTNQVDIEQYVACVVANEVWPTFQTEAYRAQAVVARTYVLYQMMRRSSSSYDVSAAQGSQVYRGLREDVVGDRAEEAALFTRGLALTYPRDGVDKIFCSYYSAACGGISQAANIFGAEGAISPLAGGVRCDYCAIAPGDTYRWGPVTMKLTEVRDKIVRRYPDLRALGGFRAIEVADRGATGRPLNLRLHGAGGKSEDILAERFRLAVGPSTLKSTDFQIECTDRQVIFKNGRGFGHGLGLCQWGMEGQARQGRRAGEILRFYFPGAKLTRVY